MLKKRISAITEKSEAKITGTEKVFFCSVTMGSRLKATGSDSIALPFWFLRAVGLKMRKSSERSDFFITCGHASKTGGISQSGLFFNNSDLPREIGGAIMSPCFLDPDVFQGKNLNELD